jgi:uncharacterized UBP type Zn finger protein
MENKDLEISKEGQQEVKEPQQQEGDSITGYVKQDTVSQLMEMGFSKNVSEKACFFNQSNLEKSIEWIYEHQQDPDFEEELRIVGKQQGEQLSEEEIKKRAKELQEYARKRYQEKQKQLEEEQEKNRIRQSNPI